ncbi:Pleckstrin homology domain-containing protein [Spinellus fusiger]|nr:Pleckstrin homology domain-containing protein [Spinellus fusiger]
MVLSAAGVIDLTKVSFVRRVFTMSTHAPGSPQRSTSTPHRGTTTEDTPLLLTSSTSSTFHRDQGRCCLEIVMLNGVVLCLEAFSSETCDVWVSQLSKLSVYWKALDEGERDVSADCDRYLLPCSSPELTGQRARFSPARTDALADTRLWSLCLFEQCRDIVKTGLLYFQPPSRGTFTQKQCIFTRSGTLLFYDLFHRTSFRSQPTLTATYTKKDALDIGDCYVYTGPLSLAVTVPLHQPPRLFSHGLVTDDADVDCVFTLWKPQSRHTYSPQQKRILMHQHSSRLTTKGEAWLFLAQSRQEKEAWVWALHQVMEHLVRA